MTTDIESTVRDAVRITRAAPLFDQLVTMLLSHAARAADTSRPAHVATHHGELRALRERLDAYFPEFQRLYVELLYEHLGSQLPTVLEALSNELVQSYLKAQKAMEHDLITALQRLADRMTSALLNSPSGETSARAESVDSDLQPPDLEETRRISRLAAAMSNDPFLQTLDADATLLGVTLPLGTRLRYVTAPPR